MNRFLNGPPVPGARLPRLPRGSRGRCGEEHGGGGGEAGGQGRGGEPGARLGQENQRRAAAGIWQRKEGVGLKGIGFTTFFFFCFFQGGGGLGFIWPVSSIC